MALPGDVGSGMGFLAESRDDIIRRLTEQYSDDVEFAKQALTNWPTVKLACEMREWDAMQIADFKRACFEKVKQG